MRAGGRNGDSLGRTAPAVIRACVPIQTTRWRFGLVGDVLRCRVDTKSATRDYDVCPIGRIKSHDVVDIGSAPRAGRPSSKDRLDEAQTARLVEAARGSRLFMPTLLAVATGMRRGEVLALRWCDVDFAANALAVCRSLEETREGLSFKQPKTQRGRRRVTLPGFAVDALRRHRTEQAAERLKLGPAYEDNELVCPCPDGRPWVPGSFSAGFIAFCRRRGFERLRFHDLRHGHATQLLQEGIHPKVVSERLGHSTIGITLDTYSHVMPGIQEEAAQRLDDLLRGPIKDAGKR